MFALLALALFAVIFLAGGLYLAIAMDAPTTVEASIDAQPSLR